MTIIIIILLFVFGVIPYGLSYLMTQSAFNLDRGDSETPAIYGANYKDIEFSSIDGNRLSGWFLENNGKGVTIILCHGLNRSRVEMLRRATDLWCAGYSVVIFDFRRHGKSEGEHRTLGYLERFDVRGAVKHVREALRPQDKIVLMGVSMGAAASLMAAAETLDVAAVISDSTFLSFEETVTHHAKEFLKLPKFPVVYEFLLITEWRIGLDYEDFDLEKAVEKIGDRPVLFIAGGADRRMPPRIAERLYQVCKSPKKDLLIVPGARHGHAYHTAPEIYLNKVLDFIAKI